MGEEWVEVAALWKPRSEGSRLLAKGKIEVDLKKGQKVLIMKNTYATDENKQPQFRIMIVEESDDSTICLICGERLDDSEIRMGDSYHSHCHEIARQEAEQNRAEEARLNPHNMG